MGWPLEILKIGTLEMQFSAIWSSFGLETPQETASAAKGWGACPQLRGPCNIKHAVV